MKISSRVIETRDIDGDSQLSVEELGTRSGIINSADANGNNLVNQEELLNVLSDRLREQNINLTSVTINLNVIKTTLGNMISELLNQSDSENVINLLADNQSSGSNDQLRSIELESYLAALSTPGINENFSINDNQLLSDSQSTLGSALYDGRLFLLNLLIERLGTPEEDANDIIDILKNQSFSIVA
ncbi:MAG: hypothetical protein HKP41_22655 [Desulfobacterales bacterium]|nr:hypothetical protein [Deltaproteobacteria bacterium]NNK97165.1 hypothetical protein [Desulfobacterales bacterium]